jgi:hypothetical protein
VPHHPCSRPEQGTLCHYIETPAGERTGIVAYAFLANNTPTKNRPKDEHRFQIKYGGDLGGVHEI